MANEHKVIVFSTSSCPWCTRAKEYLRSRGILYRDVDVARDQAAAAEMVRKSGQQGVPQLWIDGRVVVGFDQTRINQYLGI